LQPNLAKADSAHTTSHVLNVNAMIDGYGIHLLWFWVMICRS